MGKPDSSEDLEVEDDEGDDGDDAGPHQPRPVDVEPEDEFVLFWFLIGSKYLVCYHNTVMVHMIC